MIRGRTTTNYGSAVGWEIEHVMMDTGKIQQYFAQYTSFVEQENSRITKEIYEGIEEEMRSSPDQEPHYFYEPVRFDLERHEEFYPNLLFDSVFISVNRYLERRLREICRILYLDFEGSVIPNYRHDISTKYYELIKKFSKEPLSIELWERIKAFRRIRNGIVHNNLDVVATKQLVNDFNNTVEHFLNDIGRKIAIPEERPDLSLIYPR